MPALVYRTGALCAERHPVRQRRRRLLDAGQRARRRHQRRQDRVRGMRDRLRHRQGRRVLRAPEGQGPDRRRLLLAAVDRHHLRADREGARRQDPAAHAWATAASESQDGAVFPWNFSPLGTYWTAADIAIQHIAKELGGFDKLKGKKISLVYHDSPYGKEPIPALEALRQEARLRVQGRSRSPIPASSRSRSGCDPPGPARLRAAVGLGRDELAPRSRKRRPSAIRATR